METESYAPKSIKKDDLIQGLKATIEELKNEVHTMKRENYLAEAYLELAQSHVELKQKYATKQYSLEQKSKELGDLGLKNYELSAKIIGILAHQDALYEKHKSDIVHELKNAIVPILKKMKKSGQDVIKYKDLQTLEGVINDVLFPVITKKRHSLTPLEIDTARLIQEGKKGYEIAQILDVPYKAVKNARYRIRRKLGLVNQKINLKEYLKKHDISEYV